MATRKVTMMEWLKLVKRHALDDGFANVAGHPVIDAATRLKVSHQRVYQLIADETLDTIEIVNRAGKVSLTLVTEASIERYLAERVPDRNRQGYFAFQA